MRELRERITWLNNKQRGIVYFEIVSLDATEHCYILDAPVQDPPRLYRLISRLDSKSVPVRPCTQYMLNYLRCRSEAVLFKIRSDFARKAECLHTVLSNSNHKSLKLCIMYWKLILIWINAMFFFTSNYVSESKPSFTISFSANILKAVLNFYSYIFTGDQAQTGNVDRLTFNLLSLISFALTKQTKVHVLITPLIIFWIYFI